MNAPGLVYAPEHKNHSSAIMMGAVIIFLAILGCMCGGVLGGQNQPVNHLPPAIGGQYEPTYQQNNNQQTIITLSVFGIITSPVWGTVAFLLLKFSLARKRRSGQELLKESQNYIAVKEYERETQASKAIGKAPGLSGWGCP